MDPVLQDKEQLLIILAMKNDDEERLNRLLSRNGTEFILSHLQETPLLFAVKLRKPHMVDVILHYANTNVNAMTCFGRTSIFEACNPPSIEIITMLLARKANVNLSDENKMTPLMKAAGYGNVQAMGLLIEAGAHINAQDAFGRTAVIFAIKAEENYCDALNVLLAHKAKLYIPTCPQYNPLLFATYKKPELVDILIKFCKYEKNFNDAVVGAVSTNRIDIFQKLMENGAILTDLDMYHLLKKVICKGLANVFDLLWQNINKKMYLNRETFIHLFNQIFHRIDEVCFFERVLNSIINTPDFNCNLSDYASAIERIFESTPGPNYDWNLCKDTLLEFFDYINRQGIKSNNYELSILIKYFDNNCPFIAELIDIFFKYNPEFIVTMDDVIYFSFTDLNLTSLLLCRCSDINVIYLSQSQSLPIYKHRKLKIISENMLRFFLRRFTPTISDINDIRHYKKFQHINVDSLQVPTLKEIARNSLRKINNYKLKALFENVYIPSIIVDIVYFKAPINDI